MSGIMSLAVDVIAQITEYLNYAEFVKICTLGNKLWLQRLQNGGVRSVELPMRPKIYRPRLVSSMQGLRCFRISRFPMVLYDEAVLWKSITPTLASKFEEIDLRMDRVESERSFWSAAVVLPALRQLSLQVKRNLPPMQSLFPNLQSVIISCDVDFPDWSSLSLPQTLQKLEIRSWGDDGLTVRQLRLLPSSLTHLSVFLVLSDSEQTKSFAELFTASNAFKDANEPIVLVDETTASNGEQATPATQHHTALGYPFPPHLTFLDLNYGFCSWQSDLTYLPRGLETLILHSNYTKKDEDIKILPQGLTRLTLQEMQISSAALLPRSLTALELRSPTSSFGSNGWKDLPPSLICLKLEMKSVEEQEIAHLPRTLRTLHLPSLTTLTDHSVPLLPPDLTVLNLASGKLFTDNMVKELPRTLIELNLNCADLSDAVVPLLPKKLLRLRLALSKRLTDASLPLFPRHLVLLDLYGNNTISWRNLHFLPVAQCTVLLSARDWTVCGNSKE